VFPSLFAAVLMAGLLVTWSPAVWSVSVLQTGMYALGLAVAVLALIRPSSWAPQWPRSSLYIPLALIAAWGPLQLVLHTTVYRFETWYSSLYWFTNLVVFSLAVILLRNQRARAHFLAAMLYFGCGLVILSIIQSYTSPNHVFWLFESKYRVIGPFVYKNQFAAFVELIMPMALYRMLTDRKNTTAWAFLSAAMFAAVVASASRAGTVLLGVEVLMVLAVAWRRGMVTARMAGLLFAQVAVLLAICVAVVGWEALGEHLQDETSGSLRVKLLQSTLKIVRDYPWLGAGLGNWKTVYPAYSLFDSGLYANAAHNDWAQWTAEGGIPFALLLFWVMAAAAREALEHPWGAGVVFVLIHSFVDYPTREPIVGAILFSLLGAMVASSAKIAEPLVFPMKRLPRDL
jgi:O-antigen ligase